MRLYLDPWGEVWTLDALIESNQVTTIHAGNMTVTADGLTYTQTTYIGESDTVHRGESER